MSDILASWIYFSKAKAPFSEVALRELTDDSVVKNREFGITGYLVYLEGNFVQYIEGPPEPLADLRRNICRDDRHEVLQHTGEDNIMHRRFPDWFMRWVTEDDFASVSLENDLAAILQKREELAPGIWEIKIWLTMERIINLDRRLREKS